MSKEDSGQILSDVANYYTERISEHGATPRGVDWNGVDSQTLRFAKLSEIIVNPTGFSLLDLGCGYGALVDYLSNRFDTFDYVGLDVSEEMVHAARQQHRDKAGVAFETGSRPDRPADYCVASGIFNVRLEHDDDSWFDYIAATLDVMNECSRKGFAFNCLTSYSDVDKMRDYLYYADPCRLFDLCKRKYSRQVALLHDYGLYEFTIHVRKDS